MVICIDQLRNFIHSAACVAWVGGQNYILMQKYWYLSVILYIDNTADWKRIVIQINHKKNIIMKIVAFKTAKARQYNYRPVYYNKEQDEINERIKLLTEKSNPDVLEVEKFRSKIRDSWGRKHESKAKQVPNKTFYIYIIAVLALIYFIFFR